MKTTKRTFKSLGLISALACAGLMSACMGSGELGTEVDLGADVVLTGQVAGQEMAGEVTVVTTHEVDAEGNVGGVVDSTHASANGSFEMRTRLRGEKALIVRAVRAGKIYRARLENRLEAGSEHAIGVLDGFTTLDAEAWVELRKTHEGRAILAADIRASVEAYADSVGIGGVIQDSATREAVVARLVLMAKARGQARAALVAEVIARADTARPPRDSGDTARPQPRPELMPCERAAVLIASLDATHPDYALIRARFAASCLDKDTLPPPPPVCREMKARLDGLAESNAAAVGLRLRIAAHCAPDAPPPYPLTRCERAAIRLALMDPDRPAYAVLRARFVGYCLDTDPTNDDEVDAVVVSANAGLAVRVGG
jgi:hypothetical protein